MVHGWLRGSKLVLMVGFQILCEKKDTRNDIFFQNEWLSFNVYKKLKAFRTTTYFALSSFRLLKERHDDNNYKCTMIITKQTNLYYLLHLVL